MRDGKLEYIGLLLLAALMAAIGQLFFKYAFDNPQSLLLWLLPGLFFYVGSTVFYFMVLSRTHLSWVYGIGGLSYVFATILAATVLLESIPLLRWIGVATIFIGVVFISLS